MVVGLSLALHGLVLVIAEAGGLGRDVYNGQAHERDRRAAADINAPESPSCEADVALATAARLLYCTAPLPLHDRDRCARKALSDMSLGFVTCDAVALSTEVALITPEEIAQIEPEPLLDIITPEQQQEFEKAQKQAVAEKFAEEQKRLETPPKRAQVVEITRPNVEAPPEQARFMAEFDSRIDKETVARASAEEMVARPMPQELAPADEAREAKAREALEDTVRREGEPDAPQGPGKLAMRTPGAAEPNELAQEAQTPGIESGSEANNAESGLEIAKGRGAVREEEKQASEGRMGQGGGGGGRPVVPNLHPTEELLERVIGGGSVDKLDQVADGEFTALNAVRWKYAPFFNRMKRQVAQNWHPDAVYARRDPTGNVYGSKNRVTFLQITLNPRGEVVKLHVIKSSGIGFLDEEAMRAFRAAQPFPNPPQGLVDPSSKRITFAFGFHFEVGPRSGWKVFRYQ